jgi:hypothetical protein
MRNASVSNDKETKLRRAEEYGSSLLHSGSTAACIGVLSP